MTTTTRQDHLIPRLLVCTNAEEVAARTAALVVAQAAEAIADRGQFRLALSGGSTPRRAYELLASAPWSTKIRWENVEIFLGDERYVPASHSDSNFRMAREALLDHVPLPPANIHPVPTEIQPADAAAAAYENTIRNSFSTSSGLPRFDLILLGLGTNGHTASLFPNSPLLHENERLVAAAFVGELDTWRITMTLPLLNQTRTAAFLVSGQDKAGVLREVLRGPYVPEVLPAQLIRPEEGELLWITDQEAASLMSRSAS